MKDVPRHYFKLILPVLFTVLAITLLIAPVYAVNSQCEECHKKLSPELVKDFNRGKMAESMTCADCHGAHSARIPRWPRTDGSRNSPCLNDPHPR